MTREEAGIVKIIENQVSWFNTEGMQIRESCLKAAKNIIISQRRKNRKTVMPAKLQPDRARWGK